MLRREPREAHADKRGPEENQERLVWKEVKEVIHGVACEAEIIVVRPAEVLGSTQSRITLPLERRKKCRPGGLIGEKDKDDHVAWLKAYSLLAMLMAVLRHLWTPSPLAIILHLVSKVDCIRFLRPRCAL